MSVLNARQSAHDSAWTMQPPAYAGQPLCSYEQQNAVAFAFGPPQPHDNRNLFAGPPSFYPAYGAAYHAPPPPPPALSQGYYQQPQQSRHAFAGQQQRRAWEHSAPPPYHAPEPVYGYGPAFGYGYQQQAPENYYGPPEPASSSSSGHRQQEATLVGGDLDHPSFDRPPHRSTANVKKAAPAPAAPKVDVRPLAADNVEYDLISNTSPVPPPPTIELSAVPLADLATEMVWEACMLGAEMYGARQPSNLAQWSRLTSKPASLLGEVAEANSVLRAGTAACDERAQRFVPRTPELYGAIGEGRTRKVSSDGCASDVSSPSSSAPGTPAGVDAIEAVSAKKQRLAGLGFGYGSIGDTKFGSEDELMRGGFDSPVDAIRIHARRMSAIKPATAAPALPAEPTPAFRQFVRQVLTATLLAPEDLVLALYYVARIPSAQMIAPLPADLAHSITAQASAVKSAPFKILLGALMIANKTLQDNSYRNETFATVSGIPLKDVNALEIHLFGALEFDAAVRDDVWRTWVGVVRRRAQRPASGDLGDRYEVDQALQRLLRAPPAAPAPCSPASPAYERPTTPNNSPSAHFHLNLDASGPLESPLRPANRRQAYEASPSPCHMKGVTFPTSNSRAFGVELYNRF